MTEAQKAKLIQLCERYGVPFVAEHYRPQFDLPADYVGGWVGGEPGTIYVGVDSEGRAHS